MRQISFQALKDKFRRFLNYFFVLLAIILSVSLIRNILGTQESVKTIEKREKEYEALEEKNKQLKKDLEKVQSEAFIEKQIRDQLGLAREGEIILVLPDSEELKKLVPDLPQEEVELPDPIWRKWLKLFL